MSSLPASSSPRPAAWILGAGLSGRAAAELLLQRGWRVVLLDEAPESALPAAGLAPLRAAGAELRCGGAALPAETPRRVILSPGIAPGAELRRAVAARGLPLEPELDLGAEALRCPILAVTGSKGKSSLVKLLADTLRLAGLNAEPGGNYGTPVSTLALRSPALDWAVVECSSFQLETARTFRPRIGILLNLSPDHLDRHGSIEAYRAAKIRMLARQSGRDLALLPAGGEDAGLRDCARAACRAAVESFGSDPSADWRHVPGAVLRSDGAWRVAMQGSPFDNPVLGAAAAAATAALARIGLPPDVIGRGLRGFVPLPHRFRPVATIRGVRYVDDSKATSLHALRAAVRMSAGPVRLIAGGRLKELELGDGKDLLAWGVRKVYLVGECAGALSKAWADSLETDVCGTLDVAVGRAARESGPGETVLLSPGAASFDQFTDYKARGERFIALVRHLREDGPATTRGESQ